MEGPVDLVENQLVVVVVVKTKTAKALDVALQGPIPRSRVLAPGSIIAQSGLVMADKSSKITMPSSRDPSYS